jgi:hypothetical protein
VKLAVEKLQDEAQNKKKIDGTGGKRKSPRTRCPGTFNLNLITIGRQGARREA